MNVNDARLVMQLRMLASIILCGAFAACGGGGGGDGDPLAGKQTVYAIGGTLVFIDAPSGQPTPSITVVDGAPGSNRSLVLSAAGSFTFASLPTGTNYQLRVSPEPAGYGCRVVRGNNQVQTAPVTDVLVECTANRYSLSGNVSGLGVANAGLRLRNGLETLDIGGDGPFSFTPLANGTPYAVTIATEHSHYRCVLANDSGAINAALVNNITVTCRAPIAVTVTGLGAGASIQLTNSYVLPNATGANDTLSMTGSQSRAFAVSLPSGSTYAVSISNPHADYQCAVVGGNGAVGASAIAVTVTCSERMYSVGGTINGLAPSSTGLILVRESTGRPNEQLTIEPNANPKSFAFPTALPNGANYSIVRIGQPDDRLCTFPGNSDRVSGTIDRATIHAVMTCVAPPVMTVASATVGGVTMSGASNVAMGATLQLTFSAALDATTVNASTVTLATPQGAHTISRTVTGNALNIQLTGQLAPASTYTLSIGSAVRGTASERLPTPFSATFTTTTGWSAVQTLVSYGSGQSAAGSALAIDAAGNGMLVWGVTTTRMISGEPFSTTALRSRRYEQASQLWGATPMIGSFGDSGVAFDLAMNNTGDALVALNYEGTLTDQRLPASATTWSTASGVDSTRNWIGANALGFDANGAAWYISASYPATGGLSNAVYATRLPAGGVWTTATPVSAVTSGFLLGSQFALDGNGNPIVVWIDILNQVYTLYGARYTNGNWTPPTVLMTGGAAQIISGAQIASDAAGNAIVVWSYGASTDSSVYAKRFDATAGWDATNVPIDTLPGIATAPDVVMSPDGVATAVWLQLNGPIRQVFASRYIAGAWSAPTPIDDNTGETTNPSLGIDAERNVIAMWTQRNVSDSFAYVHTARFNLGTNRWGPPIRIDTQSGSSSGATLLVSSSGHALATWRKGLTLQSAAFTR